MRLRLSAGLAALAIAALTAAAPASAQKAPPADPARIAAAKELLEVTGAAKQFDAVLPIMSQQVKNIFLQMAPKHAGEISEIFELMMKRFANRKQEMLDEIAVIYARHFAAAEMAEMSRFFKSGIGAKFVTMQPQIMQQSMIVGQRWGERVGREMEAEVRRELKKRGIDI